MQWHCFVVSGILVLLALFWFLPLGVAATAALSGSLLGVSEERRYRLCKRHVAFSVLHAKHSRQERNKYTCMYGPFECRPHDSIEVAAKSCLWLKGCMNNCSPRFASVREKKADATGSWRCSHACPHEQEVQSADSIHTSHSHSFGLMLSAGLFAIANRDVGLGNSLRFRCTPLMLTRA
jgi:hypothetical protein